MQGTFLNPIILSDDEIPPDVVNLDGYDLILHPTLDYVVVDEFDNGSGNELVDPWDKVIVIKGSQVSDVSVNGWAPWPEEGDMSVNDDSDSENNVDVEAFVMELVAQKPS